MPFVIGFGVFKGQKTVLIGKFPKSIEKTGGSEENCLLSTYTIALLTWSTVMDWNLTVYVGLGAFGLH
ncbi:hypothetical protein AV530_006370 [Patagioenas fasciata monilis]|uniref:Uncharacterized protein n=1 Tax=Patagioenas fasciata monilis TaxID=372326 RepID=A0A1V4KGG3_PATFA|nr:hypothetical protein AV530_006370 [Patagioenas fasciata monilis]